MSRAYMWTEEGHNVLNKVIEVIAVGPKIHFLLLHNTAPIILMIDALDYGIYT